MRFVSRFANNSDLGVFTRTVKIKKNGRLGQLIVNINLVSGQTDEVH